MVRRLRERVDELNGADGQRNGDAAVDAEAA
jgi:hypothetical protein